MTDSILDNLCRASLAAGRKQVTLYVTKAEAHTLAREIGHQMPGFDQYGALVDIILSDTALMFGRPLRIKR